MRADPIRDPAAYLLKMARDAASKSHGVSIDSLKKIATPNEWAKRAALAGAAGAYSSPSNECVMRARRRRDPNVNMALSLIAARPFSSQALADKAFEAELANLRFRPTRGREVKNDSTFGWAFGTNNKSVREDGRTR